MIVESSEEEIAVKSVIVTSSSCGNFKMKDPEVVCSPLYGNRIFECASIEEVFKAISKTTTTKFDPDAWSKEVVRNLFFHRQKLTNSGLAGGSERSGFLVLQT